MEYTLVSCMVWWLPGQKKPGNNYNLLKKKMVRTWSGLVTLLVPRWFPFHSNNNNNNKFAITGMIDQRRWPAADDDPVTCRTRVVKGSDKESQEGTAKGRNKNVVETIPSAGWIWRLCTSGPEVASVAWIV